MRILAIDSSGLVATVAVVEEENEISKRLQSIRSIIKRHIHRPYYRCWMKS